ncbi:TolB family protein [Myxococcus eversor]|uniref:TolB family protein n=1 Tax=Myxococcus eversor TaxID=2709661 RepID=UPI0013D68B0E|nr:PD40 domain-containing protein [Myxococcus eversor]
MTGKRFFVGGLLAVGLLGGCEPFEDDGGGGGAGDVRFSKGFAFVREDDRNVFVVDDAGDPNSPQRLTSTGGAYWPSVSRDGRSIVFVQRGGGTSLLTVPTTGGTVATLFTENDAACARGCTNFRTPTFSPDGRSVVFVFSPGNSSLTSLGRVNTDGSGFQELTPNLPVGFGAPSFVPNGTAVVAPSGSGLQQLNQVAYVPVSGGAIIYSSLGNDVVAVANRVAVSPDGSQVVLDGRGSSSSVRTYVGTLSGRGNLGTLRRVTSYGGASAQETWPVWTGASQVGFLFVDSAGGDPGIYRSTVSAAPSNSVTLAVPSAAEPSYGPL